MWRHNPVVSHAALIPHYYALSLIYTFHETNDKLTTNWTFQLYIYITHTTPTFLIGLRVFHNIYKCVDYEVRWTTRVTLKSWGFYRTACRSFHMQTHPWHIAYQWVYFTWQYHLSFPGLKFVLFGDVTQRWLVVTDVSEQSLFDLYGWSILNVLYCWILEDFLDCLSLEKRTDMLSRNVSNYQ